MKKRVLGGGLAAVCSMLCFAACSAEPTTDVQGKELVPDIDKGKGKSEPTIEISKVYESSFECKVEACFEIQSDQPLDFVGIDANVDASAMSFFELGKDGKKSLIESTASAAASISLGSTLCEAIPEDCVGVDLETDFHVMACVTADVSVGVDDITVHASSEGSCSSSSYSLTASAECKGSIDLGDCTDSSCDDEGENTNDGSEQPDDGHEDDDGESCEIGKVLCDGLCVDLDLDLKNCGLCGNVCDLGKCLLGKCVL